MSITSGEEKRFRNTGLELFKNVNSTLAIGDRRKAYAITVIQVVLGLLDLIGVLLFGLLFSLSNSGASSGITSDILRIFRIDDLEHDTAVLIIGLAAACLLIIRTLLSILTTRKMLFFLSRKSAILSASVVEKLLSQNILFIQTRTTQQLVFILTKGMDAMVLQVFGATLALVVDFSLLIIIGTGLIFVNSILAISTFSYFAMVVIVLFYLVQGRAKRLGFANSHHDIKSNEKIIEVLHAFREIKVKNRVSGYIEKIGTLRRNYADTAAEIAFLPLIGKYVIETSVVLGALLLGAIQVLISAGENSLSTTMIFLAAATRIAPAVLRVQQGLVQINAASGLAGATQEFLKELENLPSQSGFASKSSVSPSSKLSHARSTRFDPKLTIKNVSFNYSKTGLEFFKNLDVEVASGSFLAIVGPSGSGKTTLVDLMLGILSPDAGEVLISGLKPGDSIRAWPGSVAYIPQDVFIANGTIRENVCLGYGVDFFSDEQVVSALKLAQLNDFLKIGESGLDRYVGDRGASLSGGQIQRIGIARALISDPKFLVMDEATSALDSETESAISNVLTNLRGRTTIIMIAHRISTLRNADQVLYVEQGRIRARGAFNEVAESVPEFQNQLRILGIV
jgi:ABC-type multidrug transport system fused ATPase/permease subunit